MLDQSLALLIHIGRPFTPGKDGDVAFSFAGCNFKRATRFRQTELIGASRDGGDEVFAGLRGIGFEFGFVHLG